MAVQMKQGVLLFSVDFDSERTRRGQAGGSSLDNVAEELAGLFQQYQLLVTWAFGNPAQSEAAKQVHGQGHEVAVLGQSSWLGAAPSRAHLVRGLASRLEAARNAGLPATSLALRGVRIQEHFDLLVKSGVTALRSSEHKSVSRWKVFRKDAAQHAPRPLRYGLWDFATTLVLPQECTVARAKQAVDRAVYHGGVCQLAIDTSVLAESRAGMGRIELVIRHVQRHRSAGRLAVRTMNGLARQLGESRQKGRPSQSVLRAA